MKQLERRLRELEKKILPRANTRPKFPTLGELYQSGTLHRKLGFEQEQSS